MLAVSVAPANSTNPSAASVPFVRTRTFDPEPGMLMQLWDEEIEDCYVEIVLIDWASILEIECFVAPSTEYVPRWKGPTNPLVLFIGDSITCGMALEQSDGGQPMPRGTLDAFPTQALSILRDKYSYHLSLDIVAYPGISLVSLAHQDDDAAPTASGMIDKFFHMTPWDPTAWTPRGDPKFICIALGTNDEANDVEPQTFRSTLERFIRMLSTTFSSVEAFYIIAPFRDFNDPDLGAIHNDLVSKPFVVDDLDIHLCDINSRMKAEHTVDGLHPTLAGHTILGEHLAQFLVGQAPAPTAN
ncbi:hypothetical protein DFH07DRAFT_1007085 [Mycena maculata]|uniref:SGNH hydrolase-type esterase domain-containing protein n=1 Tax=Mycena maculata TaxID=230809 RepID=A0AAD7JSD5_9AGAR|nr:hypothetical protein DFH07DRAFT_1007085 [Mycena maculata]